MPQNSFTLYDKTNKMFKLIWSHLLIPIIIEEII